MHVSVENVHKLELKCITGCNFPTELWRKWTKSKQIYLRICMILYHRMFNRQRNCKVFDASTSIECQTSNKLFFLSIQWKFSKIWFYLCHGFDRSAAEAPFGSKMNRRDWNANSTICKWSRGRRRKENVSLRLHQRARTEAYASS